MACFCLCVCVCLCFCFCLFSGYRCTDGSVCVCFCVCGIGGGSSSSKVRGLESWVSMHGTTASTGDKTTATAAIIAPAAAAATGISRRAIVPISRKVLVRRHIITAKARRGRRRGGPILRAHTICESSTWIEFILASIPHIVLRAAAASVVPSSTHCLSRIEVHPHVHVHAIHIHPEASEHTLARRGHRVHSHSCHS